jgi:hypothetical protein
MTFWRPVVIRAMRRAFSLASAPPSVKKNVQVARSQGREQLTQPPADLGSKLGSRECQLVRLFGDGIGHPTVAMTDVHGHQLAVEVDVALAVRVPEIDALAVVHGDGVDLVLRGPAEERVLLVEGDDLLEVSGGWA